MENLHYVCSMCVCSKKCACTVLFCQLWPVFPQFLLYGTIFRKKNTEHKTCLVFLSTIFVWNFFILRFQQDIVRKVHNSLFMSRYCQKGTQLSLHVKILSERYTTLSSCQDIVTKVYNSLFMSSTHYSYQILMNSWIFSTDFWKIPKYQIWVGAELFHEGRKTHKQRDKKQPWQS